MSRGRIFSTVPARAIGDDRLSALDIRALIAVSLFDGMSQLKANKPGCYASAATIAGMLGVDVTSFSRSLSRLTKLGYISRERQQSDRRRQTLRVLFESEDGCQFGQLSGAEIVDDAGNLPAETIDDFANHLGEIVDNDDSETLRNPPKTQPQYIPLNGETYPNELEEIDPVETARQHDAPCMDHHQSVSSIMKGTAKALTVNGARSKRKDSAEAGLTRGIIRHHLPAGFDGLPTGAQLQHFERALKAVDVDQVPLSEAREFESWLFAVVDANAQDPVIGPWAQRIYESLTWEVAA